MIKQIEAKYNLYDSMEEMLIPEAMSEILKRDVLHVRSEPLQPLGSTGSQFYRITTDQSQYILKRFYPATNWVGLGSGDTQGRAIRIWEYGILDKVPPTMQHGTLAASYTEDGFALLMEDVSESVIHFNHVHTTQENKLILDALADLHARFWNDDSLLNPRLNLCKTETAIQGFWPNSPNHNADYAAWINHNWDIFFDTVAPDVRDTLQVLMANPEPLYTKLKQQPSTLTHGDLRPENYAIIRSTNQFLALDWQIAGYLTPFIDVHFFLSTSIIEEPFDGLAYYRQQLSSKLAVEFIPHCWEEMVYIGCLADILLRGWVLNMWANNQNHPISKVAKKSVTQFNDTVRKAVALL